MGGGGCRAAGSSFDRSIGDRDGGMEGWMDRLGEGRVELTEHLLSLIYTTTRTRACCLRAGARPAGRAWSCSLRDLVKSLAHKRHNTTGGGTRDDERLAALKRSTTDRNEPNQIEAEEEEAGVWLKSS